MSEQNSNENLIGTLEQSLRQTRKAQNELVGQLKEVEAEAKRLEQEIEALEKTEQSIHSLLSRMRSGSHPSKLSNNLRDDEYDLTNDVQNVVYRNQNSQDNQYSDHQSGRYSNNQDNRYSNNQENQYSNNHDNRYSNNQDIPPNNTNNRRYQNDNYRDNSAGFRNNNQSRNNNRRTAANNSGLESISQRFADRTITQACTLLLRETGQPLHVNELYKLLVDGGFVFKGNNPTISIAVSLNRNRRFEKIAPSTFDLVLRDASQTAS